MLQEVWEAAQNIPMPNHLRDSDSYVFQCINMLTAQKDELVNENRRLCDVRPFQAILKLVKKEGDEEERKLLSRLRCVMGQSELFPSLTMLE